MSQIINKVNEPNPIITKESCTYNDTESLSMSLVHMGAVNNIRNLDQLGIPDMFFNDIFHIIDSAIFNLATLARDA